MYKYKKTLVKNIFKELNETTNKQEIYDLCIEYFNTIGYDINIIKMFTSAINEINIKPSHLEIFAKLIKFKTDAYKEIVSCKELPNIVPKLSIYDKQLKQLGNIMKNTNFENKEQYIPFYFIDSIKNIISIKDLKIHLKTIKHTINEFHIKYAIRLFVDKKIISYLIKKYNINYVRNIKKIYDIDLVYKQYFNTIFDKNDAFIWYRNLHNGQFKCIEEKQKNEMIITLLQKIPEENRYILKQIIQSKIKLCDEVYTIFKLNVTHDEELLYMALQYNNHIVYQECCNNNIVLTTKHLNTLITYNLNNFSIPIMKGCNYKYNDSAFYNSDIILKSLCIDYKLSIDTDFLCSIIQPMVSNNLNLEIIDKMITYYGVIPNKRLYSILILYNKDNAQYEIEYDEELFFFVFNTKDLFLVYDKIKNLPWKIPNIKHRLECINLSRLSSRTKLEQYIYSNYEKMDRYCVSCILKYTFAYIEDKIIDYGIGKEYLFLQFASTTFSSTNTSVIQNIIKEHNINIDWQYMQQSPNINIKRIKQNYNYNRAKKLLQ